MDPRVDRWIDEHKEEMIASLRDCVRFRSIDDSKPYAGAPFGAGCRGALDAVLGLCRDFDMQTCDMDGYIGYAESGAGEEMLGILSHLDVVPEGEGWTQDPFAGDIIDGRIFGRGVMDDKGPAIESIYALAAVQAAGYRFRRRVRLIFGCNEECGMKCLTHYVQEKAEMPTLAFSPDASYPLVNAEKNIFHACYTRAFASKLRIQSGTVVNAVPGKATAFVPFPQPVLDAAIAAHSLSGFSYATQAVAGGTNLTILGRAAHASLPELGLNALQAMLLLCAALPLTGTDAEAVAALTRAFGLEHDGASVGLKASDDSGCLTLNLGLLDWNEQGFSISVDIRAPISVKCDAILAKLDAAFASAGAARASYSYSDGYYVPEDHELVRTLLSIYRARTGDNRPPLRIGGGTYARHLQNAVAFGPERDNRENRLHMTDEAFFIEDMMEDVKMYADAIIALACEA